MTVRFFTFSLMLLFGVFIFNIASAQTYMDTYDSFIADEEAPDDVEINENSIGSRLNTMESCIPLRYTNEVKGYIRGYTLRSRERTQVILGKTAIYFPLIEKLLEDAGLPQDLKCVAVLESALNPKAVSYAGATGLWQFMAGTATDYGLEISNDVDERCDPTKSTITAIKYLKRLYEIYDDWTLSLAAYNAGPSRVNAAIKQGRSTNFWKIRKFLPKQTQNYVPAFIAASYLTKNYIAHNLKPQYPNLDLQMTSSLKIFEYMSFGLISQITDLPLTTIRALNPGYNNDYVPSSEKGRYLILPRRAMAVLQDYIVRPSSRPVSLAANPVIAESMVDPNTNYEKAYFTTSSGDNIYELAAAFNCGIHNIKAWNRLTSNHLQAGQELIFYMPKEIKRLKSIKDMVLSNLKVDMADKSMIRRPEKPLAKQVAIKNHRKYLYHQIRRNETLADIAERYANVSIKDILKLNNIAADEVPPIGSKIKIKEAEDIGHSAILSLK